MGTTPSTLSTEPATQKYEPPHLRRQRAAAASSETPTSIAYAPHRLHDVLFSAPEVLITQADRWLRPECLELVEIAQRDLDDHELKALAGHVLREEAWDVYSVTLTTIDLHADK